MALAAGHRTLSVGSFDPVAARALGVRPGRAGALLLVLLALTVVVAVQGLGNLLVVALVLAPASAALRITRRLAATLVTAAGLGLLAGYAGLVLSYGLEIAAGASVAGCAVLLALLAHLAPART